MVEIPVEVKKMTISEISQNYWNCSKRPPRNDLKSESGIDGPVPADRENLEVIEKLENSLSQLTGNQEKTDLRFKTLSSEVKEKEQLLANLEKSRNALKTELGRVENELAEKRLHVSKYSTNDQLYQFRVIFCIEEYP